uniref:Uncharacterized protein n=1 Tax=Rangifer tarandus platyrhynchus TaxID=3082113 RepID=A0ACB0FFB5_RANTA|nr:unnamed protein product [Rangifer tarandus platyrhynchus]
MAMALAFLVASSRPGSVSLTSAAADPHHGGGPRLRRLNRGLPGGWRRRKKTHKTPQMGGSLAGQEEERGGPGRRCGTSSKGARSAPSPRPPRGCRVGQAPGAACPRPRGHHGSAWTQSSLPVPGRARRWELGLRSTPLRAAQDGPEGREKPPGRSGWTSEFRGQPSPPGAAPESGAPGAEIRASGALPQPSCEGGGGGSENLEVLLSSKSLDLAAEARLEPKASESRAAELEHPSGGFLPQRSKPPKRAPEHAHLLVARLGVWGRRDRASLRARGPGSRGRDGLPHASPSNPRRQYSRSHPRPPGPGRWPPPPRLHAPSAGPL